MCTCRKRSWPRSLASICRRNLTDHVESYWLEGKMKLSVEIPAEHTNGKLTQIEKVQVYCVLSRGTIIAQAIQENPRKFPRFAWCDVSPYYDYRWYGVLGIRQVITGQSRNLSRIFLYSLRGYSRFSYAIIQEYLNMELSLIFLRGKPVIFLSVYTYKG